MYVIHASLEAFNSILSLPLAVPDPTPGPPPGSDKFLTILNWAAWIALGVCVAGVIAIGAMMAVAHRRGEGGEHAQRLAMAFVGCIVIGSASGLVGALTS